MSEVCTFTLTIRSQKYHTTDLWLLLSGIDAANEEDMEKEATVEEMNRQRTIARGAFRFDTEEQLRDRMATLKTVVDTLSKNHGIECSLQAKGMGSTFVFEKNK